MEDGTRRFRTEIVLQDMIILEKRQSNGDDDYSPDGDSNMDDARDSKSSDSSETEALAEKPAAEAVPAPPAPEGDSSLSASIDDDNMF